MGVNEESLGLVGHTKIISIDSNSMEYQFCFLCQSITLGNAVGKNQGFTSRMPLSKKKKISDAIRITPVGDVDGCSYCCVMNPDLKMG